MYPRLGSRRGSGSRGVGAGILGVHALVFDQNAVRDAEDVDPFGRQRTGGIGAGHDLVGDDDVAVGDEVQQRRRLRRPPGGVADGLLQTVAARRHARFVLHVVGRDEWVDRVRVAGGAGPVVGGTVSAAARPLGRNRTFTVFWVGQTFSVLGDAFSIIAIPLLVLEATGPLALWGW